MAFGTRWRLSGPVAGRPPVSPTPVGASMAIITDLMRNPQDAAYEAEARRRQEAGLPTSRGTRTVTTFVVALLIGVLAATAWLGNRAPTTEGNQTRRQLVARIEREQGDLDARATALTRQREELTAAQNAVLRQQDQDDLASELERLARVSGAEAATGPGIELTLDDAPSDDSIVVEDQSDNPGRVIARDLQMVTNGLWAAGAEAVSINGHRLAGNASIRFAGEAILVDYRALSRPYVVTAIGDPATLRERFRAGADGQELAALKDELGIRADLVEKRSVTVPADTQMIVRYAKVSDSR